MAPYGARVPYQLMLAPRQPRAALRGRRTERGGDAARCAGAAGAPARRESRRSTSGCGPRRAGAEHFCWRIDILPRLTHLAGLELGAGVNLNIVPPEQAAAELREA